MNKEELEKLLEDLKGNKVDLSDRSLVIDILSDVEGSFSKIRKFSNSKKQIIENDCKTLYFASQIIEQLNEKVLHHKVNLIERRLLLRIIGESFKVRVFKKLWNLSYLNDIIDLDCSKYYLSINDSCIDPSIARPYTTQEALEIIKVKGGDNIQSLMSNNIGKILDISDSVVVDECDCNFILSFNYMLNNYTWPDGSYFGVEIKQK